MRRGSGSIQNIFPESELDKDSVCRNFRRTAKDGKDYSVLHYNLDMILTSSVFGWGEAGAGCVQDQPMNKERHKSNPVPEVIIADCREMKKGKWNRPKTEYRYHSYAGLHGWENQPKIA